MKRMIDGKPLSDLQEMCYLAGVEVKEEAPLMEYTSFPYVKASSSSAKDVGNVKHKTDKDGNITTSFMDAIESIVGVVGGDWVIGRDDKRLAMIVKPKKGVPDGGKALPPDRRLYAGVDILGFGEWAAKNQYDSITLGGPPVKNPTAGPSGTKVIARLTFPDKVRWNSASGIWTIGGQPSSTDPSKTKAAIDAVVGKGRSKASSYAKKIVNAVEKKQSSFMGKEAEEMFSKAMEIKKDLGLKLSDGDLKKLFTGMAPFFSKRR